MYSRRLLDSTSSSLSPITPSSAFVCVKVNDDEGNLYKFRASAERLEGVLIAVSDKLKMPKDAILLKYQDDDGDQVVLSG